MRMKREQRDRILPLDSNRTANMPAACRSRVTNGRSLFVGEVDGRPIDGRTVQARRFRDVLESILSDLGGRDQISEGEYQLARRATALSVAAEIEEAYLATGKRLDAEANVKLVNGLNRTFANLGLRRRQRDITPPLAEYLAQKAASK